MLFKEKADPMKEIGVVAELDEIKEVEANSGHGDDREFKFLGMDLKTALIAWLGIVAVVAVALYCNEHAQLLHARDLIANLTAK